MKKLYAGVGPRNTDPRILDVMTQLAGELEEMGWKLRSGHGKGADQAFEAGTKNKEIWLPEAGFNGAFMQFPWYHVTGNVGESSIARMHHPGYMKCNEYVQRLFNRNVNILVGKNCDNPVSCVIYQQPPDNDIMSFGGTNHTLRMAATMGIPTFNIQVDAERDALSEFILCE